MGGPSSALFQLHNQGLSHPFAKQPFAFAKWCGSSCASNALSVELPTFVCADTNRTPDKSNAGTVVIDTKRTSGKPRCALWVRKGCSIQR